jgi:hypothetical protein
MESLKLKEGHFEKLSGGESSYIDILILLDRCASKISHQSGVSPTDPSYYFWRYFNPHQKTVSVALKLTLPSSLPSARCSAVIIRVQQINR